MGPRRRSRGRPGGTADEYEYDADPGDYRPLLGDYLSDRMGPFLQVDLRVDKTFVYRAWLLSTYLDIQNASYLVRDSPELYQTNFDYSERKVVGGLILPAVGIRVEF